MLCMQQCIDLCDLTPEEARAIRENATLAEILAIQAGCARFKDQDTDSTAAAEPAAACDLLDMRQQLLEEVWAAEDFDDLGRVVEHYRAYALAEAEAGPDAG